MCLECINEVRSCSNVNSPACETVDSYSGSKTTTVVGKTCQVWSTDTPHESEDKEVGDHNMCRNHDEDVNGPWCYTSDPGQEWAYCFKSCTGKYSQSRMLHSYTVRISMAIIVVQPHLEVLLCIVVHHFDILRYIVGFFNCWQICKV